LGQSVIVTWRVFKWIYGLRYNFGFMIASDMHTQFDSRGELLGSSYVKKRHPRSNVQRWMEILRISCT